MKTNVPAHSEKMTADVFRLRTRREPKNDDLERVNCNRVGEFGHFMCGWCPDHNAPRFHCGDYIAKDFVLFLERYCCPLLIRKPSAEKDVPGTGNAAQDDTGSKTTHG